MTEANRCMKYCKNCLEENKKKHFNVLKYIYIPFFSDEIDICEQCGEELYDTGITPNEFKILNYTSFGNKLFIDKMSELKKNNKNRYVELINFFGDNLSIAKIKYVDRQWKNAPVLKLDFVTICPNKHKGGGLYSKEYGFYNDLKTNDCCKECGEKLITTNMTTTDFDYIARKYNIENPGTRDHSVNAPFFNSMIKLAQRDIIQYEIEMVEVFKGIEEEIHRLFVTNPQIQEQNKPKCPTCNSANIRKISDAERVASIGFFGIFSRKINKSFKCNSCGHTW